MSKQKQHPNRMTQMIAKLRAPLKNIVTKLTRTESETKQAKQSLFYAIVRKEFNDYIKSWRIIILLSIIMLTTLASLYVSISTLHELATNPEEDSETIIDNTYLLLHLFTLSDGTLPSFVSFVTFLGPLLGIALGFDAINAEQNRGTLPRLMAQPIPRDYIINAKFVAALLVNVVLFTTLGLLVLGLGVLITGIPPSLEEILRIAVFLILCIVFIAFWLNVSILFSVRFRQATTSAVGAIAIWIFFSVFYQIIVNMIARGIMRADNITSTADLISKQETILNILRLSPNYLFTESTTTLLSPSVRSLGPLTVEQTEGAIVAPLPLDQSLLLIWPHITGLIAATLICFAIAYILFMRQDIRTN